MSPVTWILQSDTFGPAHAAFGSAIDELGHPRLEWDDRWLDIPARCPVVGPAVFHGSLGTAHRIRQELDLRPGAFCDEHAFRCSTWYERATPWLLHRRWLHCSAQELAEDPVGVAGHLASETGRVFVRPDSPLKPFSGRVLPLEGLDLAALDHGYYYDDPALPVVVCPVAPVVHEWRFVVVDGEVVAASGYEASRRATDRGPAAPIDEACAIVSALAPPEPVFVLDLCLSDGAVRLLELGPFSGADLYGCDPRAVVDAVSRLAGR